MKKMYRTSDLFEVIVEQLKTKGLLPSILDYSLSNASDSVQVKDIEWDAIGRICFGTNEGIYLDIYMEGQISDDCTRQVLMGTFKTLHTSKEAYKAMADLEVEFVFALKEFVDQNDASFNWRGCNVYYVKGGKRNKSSTWCCTEEGAVALINTDFIRFPDIEYAIVVNNEKNTEKAYRREDLS